MILYEFCCLTIFIVIIVLIVYVLLPKQKVIIEKRPKNQIRYCTNCGKEIPLDSRVCPYCGKEFWKSREGDKNK